MYPEDAELLEDVLTENRQAIEMTAIANNILSGMMDAFASIISNNLNAVMKFLASMTIVLSLPTLIASVYGMNIASAPPDHPAGFVLVMGMAVGMSALVALVFVKKDWF
jgi:magnesium transporter